MVRQAEKRVEIDHLRWFASRAMISSVSDTEYAFVDEFLRIRVLLDNEESPSSSSIEYQLAMEGEVDINDVDLGQAYAEEPDDRLE
jgi:hypothetical protein